MVKVRLERLQQWCHGARSYIKTHGLMSFLFSTVIMRCVSFIAVFAIFVLCFKFFNEGHHTNMFNWCLKVLDYIITCFPASEPPISATQETTSSTNLETSSTSGAISKKKIIIGVAIGAVVVCGVGAGIFFIPGAPELVISTVLWCSPIAGFGGP